MARPFPRSLIEAVDDSKILGVRAGGGSDHRFTGIWAVVVEGRVFARSWTLTSHGWYRTFLDDSLGAIRVGERQVRVCARPVKSARLLDAVEEAYARKYSTPGARKYVRGFRTPRRRQSTLEFTPR